MVAHVGYDKDVFAAAEEAVDVGLAVLVVPDVEHQHEGHADEVDGQDCFLVSH